MLLPTKLPNFQILRYLKYRRAVAIEYKAGSKERQELDIALKNVINTEYKIPLQLGSEKIISGDEQFQYIPHNHRRIVARFYYANERQIKKGVESVRFIQDKWKSVSYSERTKIWNTAADDIEQNYRHLLNAASMLSQSKTAQDADEDTCRLINLLRAYAEVSEKLTERKLKNDNVERVNSIWKIRPIDGFVAALSPFNMTSISLSCAAVPALMGNCVLWKPSKRNVLSCYIAFQSLRHAGLPDGVINFLPMNSQFFANSIKEYTDLAGINFAGTTESFMTMWTTSGSLIKRTKNFPRIVGELSSKNFHFVHNSADLELAANATIAAAFEFSGQSCCSCARLYVPKSIWPDLKKLLVDKLAEKIIGDPTHIDTFASSVISRSTYNRIVEFIESAKKRKTTEIIYGGGYCGSWGYYIEPTIIKCKDPFDSIMTTELLGPVLGVYVFNESDMRTIFKLITDSSAYGFTGSIFAAENRIIEYAKSELIWASSNLFINAACTGSMHGNVLFSGNKYSGNNNRANLTHNLLHWCAPQLVEEHFKKKVKAGVE